MKVSFKKICVCLRTQMCIWVHMHVGTAAMTYLWGSEDSLQESVFLPSCVFQGLRSGCQARQYTPPAVACLSLLTFMWSITPLCEVETVVLSVYSGLGRLNGLPSAGTNRACHMAQLSPLFFRRVFLSWLWPMSVLFLDVMGYIL